MLNSKALYNDGCLTSFTFAEEAKSGMEMGNTFTEDWPGNSLCEGMREVEEVSTKS
jgi:hypothetical protein